MPKSLLIFVWLALVGGMPAAALARGAPPLVDVNHADAVRLMTVPGIGPGMAAQLVTVRREGAFQNWPDLVHRVSGLGATRAEQLSAAGLTVNGLPWHGQPRAVPRPSTERKTEARARPPRDRKHDGPRKARHSTAASAPQIRF